MADEKNESRIKMEDLPKPEQELSSAEAKKVKGGGVRYIDDAAQQERSGGNFGDTPGLNGGDMVAKM